MLIGMQNFYYSIKDALLQLYKIILKTQSFLVGFFCLHTFGTEVVYCVSKKKL